MKKVCFFFFVCAAFGSRAEFIMAPNDRATQSGNTFTLNGFRTPSTYQNVYGAANFSGPVVIHGIAFRMEEDRNGLSVDVSIPRITIRVSTYPGTLATFNPSQFGYDENKGLDDRTVFEAPIHWISTDLPGTQPNPFDLKIQFSEPFTYNPANGALLINYSSSGSFTSGLAVDSHGHNDPSIGWSGGTELANLVTQFDVSPVPEPSGFFLAGLGLAVLLRKELGV